MKIGICCGTDDQLGALTCGSKTRCISIFDQFFFVFLVGAGYVLISQAATIWVKMLFPEENRGALEGMKVIFFTLIPMFLGTLIGNVIIKNTPQPVPVYDVYGHVIDVPQENLFGIAGIMVLLTLIPLYFGGKAYRKRIGK